MSYRFENYKEKDLNVFMEVFKEGFSKDDLSTPFFINKFSKTQTSKFIGVIVYQNETNKPVGIFGVLAIKTIVNSEDTWIGQAVDLTIIPEHRKKGLFTPLHDKVMDNCKREGVLFVYAMPNEASFRAFTNTGWTHSVDFFQFSKTTSLPNYIRLLKKASPRFYYHYKKISLKRHLVKNTKKVVGFPITLESTKNSIELKRTTNYLNYKLNQGASILKFKTGYVLVFIGESELKIGEIFSNNPSRTLSSLITFTSKLKIQKISFLCSHLTLKSALQENGLLQVNTSPLTILNLNIENLDHSLFCYTGLDIDTFCIDYSY